MNINSLRKEIKWWIRSDTQRSNKWS